MSDTSIETAVHELLISSLGVAPEAITDEADLVDDLGAGSLDIAELALEIESRFGFVIDDSDFLRIRTISQLVEFVQSHVHSKSEP